jgi:sulfatase maturation enzyme AslB (radical SAM superfamily)
MSDLENSEPTIDSLIANGSFCAMPFVSMMVNTDSLIKFCCVASPGRSSRLLDEKNNPYSARNSTIKEVWKSQSIKSLRNAMLAGEKIEACNGCYLQEHVGKSSSRLMMTNEWVTKIGKKQFLENLKNYIQTPDFEMPLVYLDLRLGNLCNLKCRMCSPFNSSQIAKEHFDLMSDQDYSQIWSSQYGINPEWLRKEQIWQDSNILWDELIGLIPTLKKVYMTGGEPTLIKNNYRFMKEAIVAGVNDSMELFFNLNCTNVTDEFIGLISQFSNVAINASIDGIGEINDYIRYPSNWNKISENFQKLAALPNVRLNITPVVQVHNVLDLINILKYAEEVSIKYKKDIGIDFLFNWNPKWYDITILPSDIRQQSSDQLKQYKSASNRYQSNWLIRNSVDSTINLLESPRNPEWQTLIDKFIKMTQIYDTQRSQSFEQTFPEIYKVINVE